MTRVELAQRIIAGFLLFSAAKISLVSLVISWMGGLIIVYSLVGAIMASLLVRLARYPFETDFNRKKLWIW